MIPDELIEAARRAANIPAGGRLHAARIDGDSLALLVDYGIGGIKKWIVPLSQISQPAADPIPEAPLVEVERVEPNQASPLPRKQGRGKRK